MIGQTGVHVRPLAGNTTPHGASNALSRDSGNTFVSRSALFAFDETARLRSSQSFTTSCRHNVRIARAFTLPNPPRCPIHLAATESHISVAVIRNRKNAMASTSDADFPVLSSKSRGTPLLCDVRVTGPLAQTQSLHPVNSTLSGSSPSLTYASRVPVTSHVSAPLLPRSVTNPRNSLECRIFTGQSWSRVHCGTMGWQSWRWCCVRRREPQLMCPHVQMLVGCSLVRPSSVSAVIRLSTYASVTSFAFNFV